jgi:hypothetical protein
MKDIEWDIVKDMRLCKGARRAWEERRVMLLKKYFLRESETIVVLNTV